MVRKSNYKSFRERLIQDFEGVDIQDIRELGILMRDLSYRRFKDKKTGLIEKGHPTQAQLDFAVKVIRMRAVKIAVIDNYIREQYAKHYVLRALREQTINKKKYRKGQFIPYPKK